MAASLLQLTISKINTQVFSGDVESVTVPGSDGEMTILAHHEALISPLKKGVITVRPQEGESLKFEIESGVLEISHNQATVLI